jgi:hypothetical protein
MGAVAQNLFDIIHYQIVDNPLEYTRQVLDSNHTGSFTVESAMKDPFGRVLVMLLANGTSTGSIDIDKQFKPLLEKVFEYFTSVGDAHHSNCRFGTCPIWIRSHANLEPTLSIIGNLSRSTSVLILNGENDTQTPVQQSFLLQQRLTEIKHPDHTLITYRNLGHFFAPSSQWFTELGPIDPLYFQTFSDGCRTTP